MNNQAIFVIHNVLHRVPAMGTLGAFDQYALWINPIDFAFLSGLLATLCELGQSILNGFFQLYGLRQLFWHFHKRPALGLVLIDPLAFVQKLLDSFINLLQMVSIPFFPVKVAFSSIGPELGAVHEEHIALDQAKIQTEPGTKSQCLFQGPFVLAPKFSNSFMIRLQLFHQPDEGEIVMDLSLKFSGALHAI